MEPSFCNSPAASYVINSKGIQVPVEFDKITKRSEELCGKLNKYAGSLDSIRAAVPSLTREVVAVFRNGMTTDEIDKLVATFAEDRISEHPEWGYLAARVKMRLIFGNVSESFTGAIKYAREIGCNRHSDELYALAQKYRERIDFELDLERDYKYSSFQLDTIAATYLIKTSRGQYVERPQHMYMRVALAIHAAELNSASSDNEVASILASVFEAYNMLASQRISHASPTLFNAGTRSSQLSSCFLIRPGDSLPRMQECRDQCESVSNLGGGVGISVDQIRVAGSEIKSTGGVASGITRYITSLESSQQWISQKMRPGAYAVYNKWWHGEIISFLQMGRIDRSARVPAPMLKYGLVVDNVIMTALDCDLREMEIPTPQIQHTTKIAPTAQPYYRHTLVGGVPVFLDEESHPIVYLFNPPDVPEFMTTWGAEFAIAYRDAVLAGKALQSIRPRDLFVEWFKTEAMGGNCYVIDRDACNASSNLSHYKPIDMSNLCSEITLPSDNTCVVTDNTCVVTDNTCVVTDNTESSATKDNTATQEIAVCNLAAIPLPTFVPEGATTPQDIDWAGIIAASAKAASNLDKLIDCSLYPHAHAEASNKRHRPIAVGTMGLADVFHKLSYSFGSDPARQLDMALHAAVYYGAMRESANAGATKGSFETYPGSLTSRGVLQPDTWVWRKKLRPDWEELVERITGGALTPDMFARLRADVAVAARNSEVTAGMPTATSANIVGVNECFEPYKSNVYTRKTGSAGIHLLVNSHLQKHLEDYGLWTPTLWSKILQSGGSVAGLSEIPESVRHRFRIATGEISYREIILHAAARAPFHSMSQSLNHYEVAPTFERFISILLGGWKAGLKTLVYYMHTEPASGGKQTAFGRKATQGEAPAAAQGEAQGEAPAAEPLMCQWRPGTKLSECSGCSC
jgi:ribonucleoside-diphosphate reductase alpha chain